MVTSYWPQGRLVELTDEECWHLLRTQTLGRVGWSEGDRQHIVPVNFVEHAGRLWFRTSAYSELGRTGRGRPVAFEVDEIDEFTRSGASVVVGGVAREELVPAGGPMVELETWPDGHRSLVLAIDVVRISGRRLIPC